MKTVVLLAATRKIRLSLFASYVFLLLAVAVLTRRRTYAAQYELAPFWSYREYFSTGNRRLLAQMIWNVVIFAPVGALLRKRPFRWALLIGFVCSACIEVLQLALKCGCFEFDDMLHNVLGTALGYGLAALFVKLFSGTDAEPPEE